MCSLTINLLGAGMLLTCTKKEKDGSLSATMRPRGDAKPKGNLHWVREHILWQENTFYSDSSKAAMPPRGDAKPKGNLHWVSSSK